MDTVTDTVQLAPVVIPHDFPFPICIVCQFPIPANDLGGTEFEPVHASTCTPNGDQDGYSPYGCRWDQAVRPDGAA
ncbi:hypothetical protein [Kribbella sindirgiensis]|uniref:Uncharacterized protein n=1 Tax=Kribbella sindirgiensis TaxID=1124744 RepID=A0A4R0IUH4_9ACTN|nr:hypothetical protein [Kribbella sindirgiensis]TCC35098.1 hypothetical protein E0H50_14625 [Kribbella sindirgiensis]